jgi:hypothetical protein
MNNLLVECNNFLKGNNFDYAFCGGYAIDIHIGCTTRPHGDIDISAFFEDRSMIILFMQAHDWIVYEAMGNGIVHLITDLNDQKMVKNNIFCVKKDCPFFHVELIENNNYKCEIEHIEQKKLDYVEFLFNKHTEKEFIYSRNNSIKLEHNKAILNKNNFTYLAPELVLLYKSTDLLRKENEQDFNTIISTMPYDNKIWLKNALTKVYPNGHEWIHRLKI